jgi:integrase/recombinase XerD
MLHHYLSTKYSKATAKAYYREIEIYLTNTTNAHNYNYSDIVNYLSKLRANYTNSKTINRILASIKAYYSYLYAYELRTDNPAKRLLLRDKINRDIQLQQLFTTKELEAVLIKKERYSNLESRNKIVMSLLVYQGLKPNEIASLEVKEVNLNEGTIYIKPSLKNNSRTLHLRGNQILLFKKYVEEVRPLLLQNNTLALEALVIGHRSNPMSGEDITKHVNRSYSKLYSPRIVNCQTIRQSVITNLLKETNDLRRTQAFAGHKYSSTTEKYKQSDVMQLQLALELHHPMR